MAALQDPSKIAGTEAGQEPAGLHKQLLDQKNGYVQPHRHRKPCAPARVGGVDIGWRTKRRGEKRPRRREEKHASGLCEAGLMSDFEQQTRGYLRQPFRRHHEPRQPETAGLQAAADQQAEVRPHHLPPRNPHHQLRIERRGFLFFSFNIFF
ncbi:hypothetical protein D0864_14638 [Hortaea werneckii]|uniref:Uncharacterized protein n=1 Tax=Hortaea werneckii TaxID=91943 RepID=A0A3M7CDP3_HORWE|nr:hypothetical protein D0864_14638 [Hortaea werneckii]